MSNLYEKIVNLCESRHIKPGKMCNELGFSRSAVTDLKMGRKTTLSAEYIKKMADYFGVPMEYFFDKEKAPTNVEAEKLVVPVLGEVAAGYPMFAEENILDWEELPGKWKHQGEFFALKIRGDSMAPRILDGDVVIVKSQNSVETGDAAVVLVNGDSATCKKIRITEDGITLLPINPAYEPKFYTNKDVQELPIQIIGKVVELRGKF